MTARRDGGGQDTHIHLHVAADFSARDVQAALKRIAQGMEASMATLRDELRAEMERLVDEVRQTRTATDAVATAIAGLREQLNNAVEQGDIEAVRAIISGLDEVQGQLAAAAGENLDGGDDTVPPGEEEPPVTEEPPPPADDGSDTPAGA